MNSNGIEVRIDKDADGGQHLEYSALGAVFDFYFMIGSTPKETSMQYAELIGHAALMPYWGFGFHQCKYGWQDIYEVTGVIANYSAANIPLETMWTDTDCKSAWMKPFQHSKHLLTVHLCCGHEIPTHYLTRPLALPLVQRTASG